VHCRSVVRNCYPNKLPLKELSPRTDAQCVTSEKRDYRKFDKDDYRHFRRADSIRRMSAFGGKADIIQGKADIKKCPLMDMSSLKN
jgi:hypothetical protein